MEFSNSSDDRFVCTILGEPASKSNSRKVVVIRGKIAVIKSKKARDYLDNFNVQAKPRDHVFTGDVAVGMRIWYATRRPDLDESLLLDALQDVAYHNDRQVKFKLILWGLDKENPRTDIIVVPVKRYREVIDHFIHAPTNNPDD